MKDMKTQIADTFSELLEKEDLDKITVTKLIEACQISRQTFYYHFHDIMDVLEWTFRRATHELLEKSLNESERINALLAYLQFVKKHRKKLKRLVDSRKWYQIEGMMVDAVKSGTIKNGNRRITICRFPFCITALQAQFVHAKCFDQKRDAGDQKVGGENVVKREC